jgi:hypothetical protein
MTVQPAETQPERTRDCISSRREGAIGIIEFDNPDGGFLTATMTKAIDRVTREWEADPDIRVVIFTGRHSGTPMAMLWVAAVNWRWHVTSG